MCASTICVLDSAAVHSLGLVVTAMWMAVPNETLLVQMSKQEKGELTRAQSACNWSFAGMFSHVSFDVCLLGCAIVAHFTSSIKMRTDQ
jgi:hypothetical protein